MHIVLDSSIIVAALRKQEGKHRECKNLLEKVKSGEFIAVEPFTVLIEVVAAIRRRTGSKELAERVKNDLESIDTIKFVDLVSFRAEETASIAALISVKGMDAIIIQIAKEFDAVLVSLDADMMVKAKEVVKVKNVEMIG